MKIAYTEIMVDTPRLFEQGLIGSRLRRAIRQGAEDFLLLRASADLSDRLTAVLRHFSTVLDFATPGPHAAEALLVSGRAETIIRSAPIPEAMGQGQFQALIADSGLLPFGPATLDAVISLLALQTVDDLPGILLQIRRALKPDGMFLACLLGGASLTELRQSLLQAESEMEGGISPRVAPFADISDLGGLLQRAGFALPVSDVDSFTVRYASPLGLMHDLRRMGATNALIERRKTPLRRATLLRALEIYTKRFSDPDGRVRATFEFIWISGWAPHESQQKPLKPGSATKRLADALGVVEHATGDTPNGQK
jgi:SAM-dependent methyltransferase